MTTTVVVTSDLDRLIGGMQRAASIAPGLIRAGQQAASEALIGGIVPVIIEHTPEGKFDRDASNNLQDKTTGEYATFGDTSLIVFRQSATSKPNKDGSGGGYFYVTWVVNGRKAISAPSSGPFSTGAKVLKTPWGPRKSVKAAPPHPYPAEAMAEAATTVVPVTLAAAGHDIGLSIVQAFGA